MSPRSFRLGAVFAAISLTSFIPLKVHALAELDSSFGQGGVARLSAACSPEPLEDMSHALAIEADGKILLGQDCGAGIRVARLNTDGAPDPSFGGDGDVTIGYPGADTGVRFSLRKILVSPEGKLLLVGLFSSNTDPGDIITIRLNTDGSRDNGFGDVGGPDGNRWTRIGFGSASYPNDYDEPADAVLDDVGRLLIVAKEAHSREATPIAMNLVRLQPDGALDASLAGTGKVLGGIRTAGAEPKAVLIAADGSIIVGGLSYPNLSIYGNREPGPMMVKYSTEGVRDDSFVRNALNGLLSQWQVSVTRMALQDDKIIVCGTAGNSSSSSATLLRLLEDGTVDPSFGLSHGGSLYDATIPSSTCQDIVITPSRKIIALLGWDLTRLSKDLALVRFLPNGQSDPAFASIGSNYFTMDLGGTDLGFEASLSADGLVISAGKADSYNSPGELLAVRMKTPELPLLQRPNLVAPKPVQTPQKTWIRYPTLIRK